MADELKVIALISGGKDSIFSILHCRANGHKVVALANLYPDSSPNSSDVVETSFDEPNQYPHEISTSKDPDGNAEVEDIESHMYQTIGHATIPLYARALGIPLYRQRIRGTAVNKSKTYRPPSRSSASSTPTQTNASLQHATPSAPAAEPAEDEDEIESLLPLLRRVKAAHPAANALSTGAILSTYQRTRIESVAARLGLIPLAFLWQYPHLPPYAHTSLLRDMHGVGLDARIVKVASGGLDAGALWENIAEPRVVRRVAAAMRRFAGPEGAQVGAVLGEGGEFETLAVDGPRALFRGRIVVDDDARRVVRGEAGTASVKVLAARVEEKDEKDEREQEIIADELPRRPELWDDEFAELLGALKAGDNESEGLSSSPLQTELADCTENQSVTANVATSQRQWRIPCTVVETASTIYFSNIVADEESTPAILSAAAQTSKIVSTIRADLNARNLVSSDIFFTVIFLRSMASFGAVNEVYNTLFTLPNPPARVTVAVADALPKGVDVTMSFAAELRHRSDRSERRDSKHRRALHVQSRSYWAPANIGPYSQAVAVPIPNFRTRFRNSQLTQINFGGDNSNGTESEIEIVHVAGQIPLLPATMALLESQDFREHAALSLQHLFRIGRVMNVRWWFGGAVAFITGNTTLEVKSRVRYAVQVWKGIQRPPELTGELEEDESETDIGNAALYRAWDYQAQTLGVRSIGVNDEKLCRSPLPDWDYVEGKLDSTVTERDCPLVVIAEVAELPRGAQIEWWAFGASISGASSRVLVTDSHTNCQAGSSCVSWMACLTFEELCISLESLIAKQRTKASADDVAFVEIFSSQVLDAAMTMVTQCGAMVIPCKSVWSQDCTELFAAVRWRRYDDTSRS